MKVRQQLKLILKWSFYHFGQDFDLCVCEFGLDLVNTNDNYIIAETLKNKSQLSQNKISARTFENECHGFAFLAAKTQLYKS